MSSQSTNSPASQSFALAGPSRHARDAVLPVRGDLAHIRLAGEVFVPHYAVPMPHRLAATCVLLSAARDDAEVLGELSEGSAFDVLDMAGGWAWGVADGDGAVGYVALDQLTAD
ncbi:SH3 domain-containing protein [Croceicoccus sediminis]|uniref:SH3 domain-containing protein n=1 Tax=Croceicoccus sediminis TaxID=2571150 RepID=UPI001F0E8610|nr:SH3 domain-containing protein [Croceicoccus sediminis]